MLKYLLDTNIVIYVIRRRPLEMLAMFNQHAVRMAMSAITLAERTMKQKKANGLRKTWRL